MALTTTFEWWSAEDAYQASDILKDWTSGSITSLVTGLRGEGNAINLPTNLLRTSAKEGVSGATNLIFHMRARYDSDSIFLRLHSGATGPYLEMTNGTIFVRKSDATLIGSVATGWQVGGKHTLSGRILLSTTTTGAVKLWLDSSIILNLSGVQTVPVAGTTAADGIEIHGFGVYDDIGYRFGSAGAFVDGDVPLEKWVRLKMVSSAGVQQGDINWSTFGSGTSFLDRVNEHPPDLTNGYRCSSADGSFMGFFIGTVPADVTAIWGVQFMAILARNGAPGSHLVAYRTRDGGGAGTQHNNTSWSPSAGQDINDDTLRYWHTFKTLNPGTGLVWGTEYNTTQFECGLST